MLTDFENGNPELAERLNEIMAVARKVENISGGGEVKVQHTSTGININVERRRGGGGGGTTLRKAYVKTEPGAVDAVVCFLDTDTTGDEITVDFVDMISGDTDLANCFPPLPDGLMIPVWYDVDTWRPALPIGVIDRCN